MASFLFLTTDGSGIRRGEMQIPNVNNATVGGTGDSNSATGAMAITPFDILIKNATRRVSGALGSGASINYQIKKNATTPSNLSSIQTITHPAQDLTNDLEITLPTLVTTNNSTILQTVNFLTEWPSTSPAPTGSNGFFAFEYQVSGHSRLSLYHIGVDLSSFTIGASDEFHPPMGNPGVTTTRSQRQVLWPCAGTFQFFAVAWKSLTTGTQATLTLEVGTSLGAATSSLLVATMNAASPTSDWQGIIDTSSTLAVSAGNFVNWKLSRTAGTGTSIVLMVCMGFTP